MGRVKVLGLCCVEGKGLLIKRSGVLKGEVCYEEWCVKRSGVLRGVVCLEEWCV